MNLAKENTYRKVAEKLPKRKPSSSTQDEALENQSFSILSDTPSDIVISLPGTLPQHIEQPVTDLLPTYEWLTDQKRPRTFSPKGSSRVLIHTYSRKRNSVVIPAVELAIENGVNDGLSTTRCRNQPTADIVGTNQSSVPAEKRIDILESHQKKASRLNRATERGGDTKAQKPSRKRRLPVDQLVLVRSPIRDVSVSGPNEISPGSRTRLRSDEDLIRQSDESSAEEISKKRMPASVLESGSVSREPRSIRKPLTAIRNQIRLSRGPGKSPIDIKQFKLPSQSKSSATPRRTRAGSAFGDSELQEPLSSPRLRITGLNLTSLQTEQSSKRTSKQSSKSHRIGDYPKIPMALPVRIAQTNHMVIHGEKPDRLELYQVLKERGPDATVERINPSGNIYKKDHVYHNSGGSRLDVPHFLCQKTDLVEAGRTQNKETFSSHNGQTRLSARPGLDSQVNGDGGDVGEAVERDETSKLASHATCPRLRRRVTFDEEVYQQFACISAPARRTSELINDDNHSVDSDATDAADSMDSGSEGDLIGSYEVTTGLRWEERLGFQDT